MKCPKCGYLGFERVERCRNCGYDFSFVQPVELPELPIKIEGHTVQPLDDLRLGDAGRPSTARELPLFGEAAADDVPLITRASPPRTPLAVRRATPEVPRLRGEQLRTPAFDLSLDSDLASARRSATPTPDTPSRSSHGRKQTPPHTGREERAEPEAAGIGARLVAVGVDLLILATVDAVVMYLTMQICGVTIADLGILPKGPLVAFILVQNVGYLVAFTAGGQTLGKMATGIRVVQNETESPMDLGHALLRTIAWIVLAVPAGLGFVTALFTHDHRGLHDRFAGTRVVR